MHLVRRFLGSLRPGGPRPADESWVAQVLSPEEHKLWRRMSGADRRHAAGVGRRVERTLGAEATTPVLVAALLHDVGKVASGLGTYGRVVATMVGAGGGRAVARDLSRERGMRRKVGLYLRHPELGADMLTLAGSDPLAVTWTREHHLSHDDWTLPPEIASALKAADDD